VSILLIWQFCFLTAKTDFPGLDGFLGSRASLMLDVVFLAMFVVTPLLVGSVYLVKYQRHYALHKQLQLAMAWLLLVAVLLFEIDIRVNGWEERAAGNDSIAGSPYFDPAHKWTCPAGLSLMVHLTFAVPTLLLWIVVVVQALRRLPSPPLPGSHSRWHARWGMVAAVGMTMTSVTGWLFYWLAFVAS
jgi:putative membrane protein